MAVPAGSHKMKKRQHQNRIYCRPVIVGSHNDAFIMLCQAFLQALYWQGMAITSNDISSAQKNN